MCLSYFDLINYLFQLNFWTPCAIVGTMVHITTTFWTPCICTYLCRYNATSCWTEGTSSMPLSEDWGQKVFNITNNYTRYEIIISTIRVQISIIIAIFNCIYFSVYRFYLCRIIADRIRNDSSQCLMIVKWQLCNSVGI